MCQTTFIALKKRLVDALVLVRPDFNKPFILDVDWSIRGVGTILSQKFGRQKQVIAYASKGLSPVQRRFHPMEGMCYALIWGIMYFRQYFHQTLFLLRIDHKPLEWLAIVSYAYGRRGCWIAILQDFQFKIIHRARSKHLNVDALSQNLVGFLEKDEDF
jgi:hypothetical protein